MKRQQLNTVGMGTLLALGALGCGGGGARSHSVPWGDERTNVIDSDRSIRELDTPSGEGCLELGSDECVKPQDTCDGRAADVVLDENGKLLETVCYPEGETLSVEEIAAQDGNVEQNQNDSVIVLDDVDDGVDIEGDLAVDANNVVIYGDSPETSVISGDVSVDGNNIIVRGVRIAGDVEIKANNAVFLHCVIEGSVNVTGNNAVLTACDVLGSVSVHGNNTQLSGNHIVGALDDFGKNTVCDANVSADDADDNGVIEQTELGAAVSCAGADDTN